MTETIDASIIVPENDKVELADIPDMIQSILPIYNKYIKRISSMAKPRKEDIKNIILIQKALIDTYAMYRVFLQQTEVEARTLTYDSIRERINTIKPLLKN